MQLSYAQNAKWGKLANDGFKEDPVKSTVFFTGNWRNGVQFYDYNPSDNRGLFTMHPADARHLGWSESAANRDFAVSTIIDAGINVINFSYWGLPGSDNWAYWAPMQCATQSHDELFDATLGKPLLVAPFIESFAPTDSYPGFSFMDDFPGTVQDPAPELVILLEDLIDRYLINNQEPAWAGKWARIYDQEGQERYMVSIIHVASNQDGMTDFIFAEGFDRVAQKILDDTGISIGFALDVLPPDNYAPGIFKATPAHTGTYLAQQESILAVQCFIPEIWEGKSDENELIAWKENFTLGWLGTGIPLIHDISSGYDAHIVFPTSPVYGNNKVWRDLQESLIQELGLTSFAVNAWNGYTEGFAGVPTVQYGDSTYQWICDLLGGSCGEEPPGPESLNISIKNDEFNIFPNPAKERLMLTFRDPLCAKADVRLYSCSSGSLVYMAIVSFENNNVAEMNISGFRPGLYIVKIGTRHSVYSGRIVIE